MPPAVPAARLAEIRSWATHSPDGPSADRDDLFRQIDHLTARLDVARQFTPRPIERFDLASTGTDAWMTEDATGEYVRHSDHLDSLAQTHTALNLTTHVLSDATAALERCRSILRTPTGSLNAQAAVAAIVDVLGDAPKAHPFHP